MTTGVTGKPVDRPYGLRQRAAWGAAVLVALAAVFAPAWFAGADDTAAQKESPSASRPGSPEITKAGEEFARDVKPLAKKYCLTCHSTEKKEGELDLEQFASITEVRRHVHSWQRVAEMLDNGEMPPKDAPQMAADERRSLREWVRRYLDAEARADAGDPGRVVLRRLSNAEYTYTIRDITGVDSLDPAREFPVDGAAGEGFTNTGSALVMSPSLLTKYIDAAKGIAAHAVLLPDGIRFSPHATRRDWTNDIVGEIRQFYRGFTDPSGATRVNLQGLVWDTNEGGRLPLDKYFAATLEDRDAIAQGKKSIAASAAERGLSPKYLGLLWSTLNNAEPSPLLDGLRARWKVAKPADAAALSADVARWQQALWKFSSVGHIGKVGGPKAWLEPVSPIAAQQEIRYKLPAAADGKEVVVYLTASDAGDGRDNDFVLWQQPRLVAPGRPDLLLRDVRTVSCRLAERRKRVFASVAKCLAAATEASAAQGKADVGQLAAKHGVDADVLAAWLNYLGIGTGGVFRIDSLLTGVVKNGTYASVTGWGNDATPVVVANSSDQHLRVPGNMKPHGVAMHPSPTLQIAAGWRSPVAGTARVEGKIVHAHPECGNGVTWSLELRRGATRQRLAGGVAQGPAEMKAGPFEKVAIQPGDVISLLVGPRDGNHSCDLTAVDLSIATTGEGARAWDLAQDVSGNILASNPHADRFGNQNVWSFYTEPVQGQAVGPVIPVGSVLARWQAAAEAERPALAEAVQQLLTSTAPAKDSPDAALHRQLSALGGPLLGASLRADVAPAPADPKSSQVEVPKKPENADVAWGLDPALFGRHPDGGSVDAASLCLQAPTTIAVRLPADLVEGCELVTTAVLESRTGREGSVQLQVGPTKPAADAGLAPSAVKETTDNAPWTSTQRGISHASPIIVAEGSKARGRIEAAIESYRAMFPAALCYVRIVPVDEVVTLTLFYREDDQLRRLMLDDQQAARLDRLWNELRFVSQDALTLVDAYLQLMEYATQDADPKVFEPLRKPINDRAAAFRQALVAAEPAQLEAAIAFAGRAYRRPLAKADEAELRTLYRALRKQLPHDDAIRLLIARVLASPTFLYKFEQPGPGERSSPVSDNELANRLSYFLWSSAPDKELLEAAAAGQLRDPKVLAAQTRRMLQDDRVRRLAKEFACQWLHVYDFDALDEKSERHFPEFIALRGAMYEETILFFADLFQHDRSAWDMLDSDGTFVNEKLAKYYGIPNVAGDAWRRVEGVKQYGRGGILGLSTTLAKQSGASRTSPILRGNWVSEVLLGEKLPRPPKGVPPLPDDESATAGLTVRQLVEKHSSDPKCNVCHKRIDAYGFALEGYDAIGRRRDKDLAGRAVETRATAMDGAKFDGLDGLRGYLLTVRREAFLRQFSRKLLGYALGRSVQLSDEPLLAEIQKTISTRDGRMGTVVEQIVLSRQFREIRAKDFAEE